MAWHNFQQTKVNEFKRNEKRRNLQPLWLWCFVCVCCNCTHLYDFKNAKSEKFCLAVFFMSNFPSFAFSCLLVPILLLTHLKEAFVAIHFLPCFFFGFVYISSCMLARSNSFVYGDAKAPICLRNIRHI